MISSIRQNHRHLSVIIDEVLQLWPTHLNYLASGFKSMSSEEIVLLDHVASDILILTDNELPEYAKHYKWMCERFFEEEVYFRRNGTYRLDKVADAIREVYSDPDFMGRYMGGLMLSQVLWINHANCALFFVETFLKSLNGRFDYLEIGPGHGLFAAYAARDPACASMTAWDVSPTSLEHSEASLRKMGVKRPVKMACRDIEKDKMKNVDCFDVVVISEVLEHLEQPDRAMSTVANALRPGGVAFVNIPINSPAPDHIFHLSQPKQVCELVEASGLKVRDSRNFPTNGYNFETAMERKLTVSCAVIAEKPAETRLK